MNWQNKTCEKCTYKIDGDRSRFPPNIHHPFAHYPTVTITHLYAYKEDTYLLACAEYKEFTWE